MLLLVFGGIVFIPGCAVDNQFIAGLPLFEARSDRIEGFDPPHVRGKLIREKGTQGATASEADREILVAQLMYEYKTSPDPNMRRATVDSLAKIPHPDRDRYMREILRDDNPFVRISALEALGKTWSGSKESLTTLLIEQAKTDPDKDVRVAAVRILGDVTPKDSQPRRNITTISAIRDGFAPEDRRLQEIVVLELGNLLHDRDPAVRYASMQSLRQITNLDYGHDINRWLHYIRYVRGEVPDLPSERTFTERLPTIALPMFK